MTVPTLASRYHAVCHTLGLPVWRPGMRALMPSGWAQPCAERVPEVLPNGGILGEPDFDDPATLGCLLAAARRVWGPHCSAMASQYEAKVDRWRVFDGRLADDGYGHEVGRGHTEAEALVVALEAAATKRAGGDR